MDVTPLIPEGRQIIQSYGPNGFKVSGEHYPNGLIVTPSETTPWVSGKIDALTIEDFSAFIEKAHLYDVFLLGTGQTTIFPSPGLMKELKANHVKPDIMDTGAACRTYNVLMAEDRRVAALLLPL